MKCFARAAACAALISSSIAVTISEINGNRFISPLRGQTVTNVSGLVTAKGPNGVWLRGTEFDSDPATSESIYVFDRNVIGNVTVGDIVTLDGTVFEFRSSSAFLFLTEITTVRNLQVVSSGNAVEAVVIGLNTEFIGGRSVAPPTEQASSLDDNDVFSVPNNRTQVSVVNPVLQPATYGLDFWESLNGELVTVQQPRALSRPNSFGDTWVIGNWRATGRNGRTGLTLRNRDSNPEAILIGDPLDGSDNPAGTKLGDTLEEITGVVTYAFGFYRILPTTNLKIVTPKTPLRPRPFDIRSNRSCSGLTFGDYNVENLAPNSTNLQTIAQYIVRFLRTPTVVFLQEIQDDNGPDNNGTVDADLTLKTLADAISSRSRTNYSFVDVDPVNNQDGGQPGGNIRNAYLYDANQVRLRNPNPATSTQANEVLEGPALKYNPGRILDTDGDATDTFQSSRKPLVAQWETLDGANTFFTVNVHFTSKGGSSSIQGDLRPPVNGGVSSRLAQMQTTGQFIAQILAQDPEAKIITAGDFNEFAFVEPVRRFASTSKLTNLEDAVGRPNNQRYTYLFDQNCQQLDYMWVSSSIAARASPGDYEHVHLGSWASADLLASDHDPSIAKLNVCAT